MPTSRPLGKGWGMSQIAIIVGHTRTGTFCEAAADAYKEGAEAGGHSARIIHIARLRFDPILKGAYVEPQPREPDLETAYQAIQEAGHLVFIFPLWLGDMPAILKGFLERLLQPEIIEPAKQGKFVKVLKGKSARVVVTMGMPGFVYRWWFGNSAVHILKRNILGFMGVTPVRSTLIGNIEGLGDQGRAAWLARLRDMGRKSL